MSSEEWSSDANDAVQISLVQRGPSHGLKILHRFNPTFTYPIFGEEERIFGYKGLEIDVRFAAHNLRPNVIISYEKRFKAVGDTVALDINKTLKDWLPAESFTKAADFEKEVQNDAAAKDFRPPGRLLHTYNRKGKTFEIWAGSLLDPAVREILDRMQIFISFFIEGGRPLNTEDADWTIERWTVYFVYERILELAMPLASPYSLVGYATTYRFYTFQPLKNKLLPEKVMAMFPPAENIPISKLPSRLRISQFLILPPHQHAGHGSALYSTIYSEAMADPTIRELTVEDPSEEFDALRDVNDWKVLEPRFRAVNVAINTSPSAVTENRRIKRLPTAQLLPVDTLRAIRANTKIAGRQFARQLEMFLLSLIPYSHRAAGGASLTKLLVYKSQVPDPSDKSYYWWRLILKQRIYKKNKDILQQLDVEDRLAKVEESVRAQEDEYERLLLQFVTLVAKEELLKKGGGAGDTGESSARERKRKLIVDEDEDEDDDDGDEAEEVDPGLPDRKKSKA